MKQNSTHVQRIDVDEHFCRYLAKQMFHAVLEILLEKPGSGSPNHYPKPELVADFENPAPLRPEEMNFAGWKSRSQPTGKRVRIVGGLLLVRVSYNKPYKFTKRWKTRRLPDRTPDSRDPCGPVPCLYGNRRRACGLGRCLRHLGLRA